MATWTLAMRGGSYDGYAGKTSETPRLVIVCWACAPDCGGHATFDASNPAIVLKTAEAYRRVEVDHDARRAIYEVGDGQPGPELELKKRELVPVGAGDLPPWARAIAQRMIAGRL